MQLNFFTVLIALTIGLVSAQTDICTSLVCIAPASACCFTNNTGSPQSVCYNPLTHQCCENRVLCAIGNGCCGGSTCFDTTLYTCCEQSGGLCLINDSTCCPVTNSTPAAPGVVVRQYVLLATDGFASLATDENICPSPSSRARTYIHGFVGGAYIIDGAVVNSTLNFTNPANWAALAAMAGRATIPSPLIWADVGDQILITIINLGSNLALHNTASPVTFSVSGMNVPSIVDGFFDTSFGVPVWNQTTTMPTAVTYLYVAEKPGTFPYFSTANRGQQIALGMYGAMVIYPSAAGLLGSGITVGANDIVTVTNSNIDFVIPATATRRNFAYNDANTYFDKEYVLILSEIDPAWNQFVQTAATGLDFNRTSYLPSFYLLNGRSFPETLLPNPLTLTQNIAINGQVTNLARVNYESAITFNAGQRVLLRVINMGFRQVPWKVQGGSITQIAADAIPSSWLTIAKQMALPLSSVNSGQLFLDVQSSQAMDAILAFTSPNANYTSYVLNGLDGFSSLCSQLMPIANNVDAAPDIPLNPTCPNFSSITVLNLCTAANTATGIFPQIGKLFNSEWDKQTNNGVPGGQLTWFQINPPTTTATA